MGLFFCFAVSDLLLINAESLNVFSSIIICYSLRYMSMGRRFPLLSLYIAKEVRQSGYYWCTPRALCVRLLITYIYLVARSASSLPQEVTNYYTV